MDKIIQFLENSSSTIIFIGAIIAAIGGLFGAMKSAKETQDIQSKGAQSVELGENIKKLSMGIDSLQKINDTIIKNTHHLGEKNFVLGQKTKQLTEDIDNLTIKANTLLGRIHGEITGGSSVPVVRADIGLYPRWSPTSYRNPEPLEFSGEWRIDFRIQNYGEFPLSNVRMFQQTNRYRELSEEKELDNVGTIPAGDIKSLNFIQGVWPTVSDPITYNIKVKWKIEYTYSVTFGENDTLGPDGMPKLTYFKSDQYSYKGKVYQSIPEFVKAVRADLQQ